MPVPQFGDPVHIPAAPGAYVLAVRLARPRRLCVGALGRRRFPAGLYLYAGSARGPGGLRARLARHLRAHAVRHWHIDRLLAAGQVVGLAAYPGESECALLARLLAHEGASVPVPGFGGTDCRRCPAHLVRLDARVPPEAALAAGNSMATSGKKSMMAATGAEDAR